MIVGRISKLQTTIAAALEEQSPTTAEIRRGTADAATATGTIGATMGAPRLGARPAAGNPATPDGVP